MKQVTYAPTKRLQIDAQPRRRTIISLTPLIDVVFILLVFFMLASSFLDWHAIDLNAPGKTAKTSPSMEKSLLIEIDNEGLLISGQQITLGELRGHIQPFLQSGRDQTVFVKPADGIQLQKTITVMDALNAAGAKKVSLIRGRKR